MSKDLQPALNIIEQSAHLSNEERNMLLKSLHDAKKELEIESSLESVRTVAMSMNKRDDMLDICHVISNQLELLNVKEIRNVQTAIFYKEKGTYMNYEYYAKHDKTFITETTYTDNKIHQEFADKMLKGNGEFMVAHIIGDEVKDWLAYQKTTNVFIDDYLSTASSLNYYWFSLGAVALGISTYSPLNEEETNLFKRFLKVFELSYRRYLDIEKAEAQAREAQIELSLERVRAKTMAMHNSADVGNTVGTMFDELVALGVKTNRCGILIYGDANDTEVWTAKSNSNGEASLIIGHLDLMIHPMLYNTRTAWKNKEPFSSYELSGEDLINYYKAISNYPGYPTRFNMAALPSKEIQSVFYFPEGAVFAFTPEPIPAETSFIFKRFADVFGQTYRRYLDLQKAEAQARESQIQLALERVRARTMAMQKSEELSETVSLLFKQLIDLGIKQAQMRTCAIVTLKKDEPVGECWITKPDGNIIPQSFIVPYDETSAYKNIYAAWKNGEKFLVVNLAGDELVQHLNFLKKYAKIPTQQFQALPDQPTETFTHAMFFSQGYLFIISNEPLPEYHDTFKRFGNIFQQTYTRFLDLQKAEAQTRESQIQLALERVRARTMAMQKSDELSETVFILFQQFKELGENPDQATIGVINEDEWVIEYWVTMYGNQTSQVYKFSIDEPDVTNKIYKAWKEQKRSLVIDLSGKELYDFATYRASKGGAKYNEAEKRRVINVAFFSKGLLNVQSNESRSVESIALLERFAAVFQQTYTRFLDLTNAEAQARESQIEAALERVRSRSMAMQKSEELKEVIQVVYDQFVHLNINVEHTGFIMDYKERDDMHIWLADKHEVPSEVSIPYFDSPHWNSFKEAKEKGTDFFANLLSFEEKNKFYKDLFKLIPGVPEEAQEYYFSVPGLAGSTVLLDNVGLYIENFSGTPYTDEENNTLMRFGKVFQQTYTRFNDLQKAEAQALEVVKRASVDRVRAEIASMRTTKDLERITPLIWNELKTLGVPFTRCGVFIMDEEKQQVQTMLSTPDGKAIATLHVPFNFDLSITTNGVEYWRRKEIYKEHWDRNTFIRSWSKFDSLSGTSVQTSHVDDGPENLYLHLLPFLQGMLYAGNDTPLNEDQLQLVQNLADAFSTAYARYEDFNKLEAAKQTVEKTLVDLKQAQTQLVQAEKMASLGELTAGIAHEIQNPLNFVNNFSDVNTELIEELKVELRQGNDEEVIAIANDIKSNEEKINHHGKRADAIVKGMLQHSRSSTGQKELTDINALADEYLRLAYHGLRAKEKSFNAAMKTDFDASIGKINIIPQDIGRVLLNLYNNAFYAVSEKLKAESITHNAEYKPTVSVQTKKLNDKILLTVMDNGNGIPPKILDKIFQPFFTTKPTGQGTGLGLSLSYDIIKAHGGEIKVETKESEGSEFIIQLPIQ